MPRQAVRVLACLAAGVSLLGGCATAQQASTSLPPAAAPAASAATASLPPLGPADFPVPTEARQKTPDGVRAFAGYYLELSNRLLNSFESSPLRELSRNCVDCDQMAAGYDHAKAAGYHCTGGILTITSTGSSVVDGDRGELSYVLNQSAIVVKDSSGEIVPSLTEGEFKLSGGMTLEWDQPRTTWLVTQYTADRI